MKSIKTYVAIVIVAAFGITGCSNDKVIECDRGDQIEFDSDCGYWRDGKFVWYSWVVKGEDSLSPAGFEQIPDDDTAPQENSHLPKKSKSSKAKR